jgi:hypothetical protein
MKKATRIAGIAAVAAVLYAIPASAVNGDGNGDRIPDRWETRHHLPLNVNQAPKDQDQDGLRNLAEFRNHTDPRDADTDADGTDDQTECQGHRHGPPPPPPGDEEVPPEQGPVAP